MPRTPGGYGYGGSGMVMGVPTESGQPYSFEDVLNRNFAGQQKGLDRDSQMAQLKQSQAPEMQKLAMQNAHWGALFPYLQKALGGMGGFSSKVGGASGAGPRISGGPVFGQQMQQDQVNNLRAQGAQETAGGVQSMQNRLAGSGFGARSPLAAALESQMGMANQANVANQVRDYRQNAAQTNAQHTLGAQQAQESQYSNRMQEDIARRRNTIGYQQGLLGMLGQFL